MNKGNNSNSNKIFVIGSGRSGTHWLGYLLEGHPEIDVSIEKPRIFTKVTKMALDSNTRPVLFPKLIELYNKEHKKVIPKYYADKSHPNIWLVEALSNIYPNAYFIGIQRNPYATVSSMLKHDGVLKWHDNWREFPLPNKFLGISESNANEYEKYPLAKKCALRWLAHKNRMSQLVKENKYNLHVVSYEKLINQTEKEIKKIEEFLGLTTNIPIPEVKKGSLNKWTDELSGDEINQIKEVVGNSPDFYL